LDLQKKITMTALPENEPTAPTTKGRRIKNMALFLASPFIGLFYAVLLPGKLFQLAMNERKAGLDSSQTIR